ncbi:MAG TPA: hypothetical protein VGD05_02275 [Pyrinomonadaceae bacterium]
MGQNTIKQRTILAACGHQTFTSDYVKRYGVNPEKISFCRNCLVKAKFLGDKIKIKHPELLEDRHRQQIGA